MVYNGKVPSFRLYTFFVNTDTDCGAVETGFESRRRHGCLKCMVPLRHGGTLNSRQASSPLVWLVEGKERWEASGHPCSPSKLGWNQGKSYLHGAQS
ncbi:hypothetical protein TNCV_1958451 [Trichonephila clavipes]|nr:hypothetical protein TNCV_1958451 [Trichonephila clavipes]